MKLPNALRLLAISLIVAAAACSLAGVDGRVAGVLSAVALSALVISVFLRPRRASFGFSKVGAGREAATVSPDISFNDVAANDVARSSLIEISEFLKNPQKFAELGARIPHGVLLYGPPGTGKTLLARALAGEAKVPFIAMNGSDFVEMYVGVGAGRVRDAFKRARKFGKCVIFIDEIDSLGRARGLNSSDERDQTLNALLSEMSGFKPSDGVIVVAATNRVEMLDPALLRPGRFDRRIEVGMPGIEERLSILKLHSRNKPLGENVNLDDLAVRTTFFSGASLENLLNEAAIRAARRNSKSIEESDVQAAYVSVIAGEDGASRPASLEKSVIALHEAGHAVVSHALIPRNRIERVSIMPCSGGAAGYNLSIPEEKSLYSKLDMERRICVLLAGRAAEALVFGTDGMTDGASNDLRRAAEIAASMVNELGMGGDIALSRATLSKALGGGGDAFTLAKDMLDSLMDKTIEVLRQNFEQLTNISKALNEREAICKKELDELFAVA